MFVEELPIPQISSEAQKPFEILVDCILYAKDKGLESEASIFESVIDGLVYDLYFEKEMKKANCYITDRIIGVVKPFIAASFTRKVKVLEKKYDAQFKVWSYYSF